MLRTVAVLSVLSVAFVADGRAVPGVAVDEFVVAAGLSVAVERGASRGEGRGKHASGGKRSGGKRGGAQALGSRLGSPTRAGRTADLAVLVREKQTRAMHVLVASSRPFAHRSMLRLPSDRGVQVWLQGRDGLRLSWGRPSPQTPAIPAIPHGDGQPSEAAITRSAGKVSPAGTLLDEWVRRTPAAERGLSAVLTGLREAAWRGPACRPDCHVRVTRGLVVLARGLSAAVVESVASAATPTRRRGARSMFRLAERLRELWPTRLAVRSIAYLKLDSPIAAVPLESLFVDHDPRGRAETQLSTLHAWHLGEVVGPAELDVGAEARVSGNKKIARASFGAAVDSMRTALDENRGVAVWHARLALALSGEHRLSDEAVREVETALSLAPRSVEIRLMAARVFALRGDRARARKEVGAALRIAPDDPDVGHAVRDLDASGAVP